MNASADAGTKDRHLLIAVDESEPAKRAVLYVADFLGGFPGFRITLLSVIPKPEQDFFESEMERTEWTRKKEDDIRSLLARYREVLIQSGFPSDRVNTLVVTEGEKPLADAILEFRCDLSCCTVVVGRGHKSKTEEFLFGSLSSQLIHLAKNCAVWVIE